MYIDILDVLTLTAGQLVAVVSVSEVLGVFHNGDAGHPDDHGVRPGLQGARRDDAVVDVMKGTGRVFLAADHSHRTWRGGTGKRTDSWSDSLEKL